MPLNSFAIVALCAGAAGSIACGEAPRGSRHDERPTERIFSAARTGDDVDSAERTKDALAPLAPLLLESEVPSDGGTPPPPAEFDE